MAHALWFLDYGATNHVISNMDNLQIKKNHENNQGIITVNGSIMPVSTIGDSCFSCGLNSIKLNDIMLTTTVRKNLISF